MKAELNLNDSRGRALARLILALRDIREAKSFAHLVVTRIHLPNDGFFRPLSYASTIAYSRPFTGSRGYPKLPPGYSAFDRLDYDELHKQILLIRHKCVAHSDPELNQVVLILGNVAPLQTPRHAIRSRQLALGTFALFRDLCEYQLNRLKKDIAKQFTGTPK